MKKGLFFGSFNPIHTGHLIIANSMLNEADLDKVCFVVSPQNPFKNKQSLLNAEDRLKLVSIAIEGNHCFDVSDMEFKMPLPSYTIDSIDFFEQTNPEDEIFFILGSDSYLQLNHWKGYEKLIRKNLLVYGRPGHKLDSVPTNVKIINSPLLNISSTYVRSLIKDNKSIRYLVPEVVAKEIERNNFYKL